MTLQFKEMIDNGDTVELVAIDTDTQAEYRTKEARWIYDSYAAPGEQEAHVLHAIARDNQLPT